MLRSVLYHISKAGGSVLYISWNNTGVSHIKLEHRSADIESNSNGESAVHQAAKTGHQSTVQFIKFLGAGEQAQDDMGLPPSP